MRTLPIPPAANEDKDSLEMLRAWVINGDLQISMSSWIWKHDVAPWGQLLSETIYHLATAISEETKQPKEDILSDIKQSLDHHFENPRDCLIGDFVDPDPDKGNAA
jgi:hypothetical protein